MGFALQSIGSHYCYGLSVQKDTKKAIEFYQRAVDSGNPLGMARLANIYETGDGVTKDLKKAVMLHESAADLGINESMKKLIELERRDTVVELDYDKVAKYYLYFLKNSIGNFYESLIYERPFKNFLSKKLANWREELHKHWKCYDLLDHQISTLLLISKFRRESVMKECLVLVKGVMMKIIKFLCHFSQE